jgi:anti-sigma B factor antagonist
VFEVHHSDHGQWAVLTVIGDLDVASAPALRAAIIDRLPDVEGKMVLDLSGVHFIDSMGLGALIGGLKRARALGGDLRLSAPAEPVRRILELTRLDRALVVADGIDNAVTEEPLP